MKHHSQPFLIVRAGDLLCALELSQVGEVLRPLPLSRVAGAPSAVSGLAVVRGRSMPVLDLTRLLSGGRSGDPTRWVTLNAPGAFALAVDGVDSIRWLDDAALEASRLFSEVAKGALTRVGSLDRNILLHFESAKILAQLAPHLEPGGRLESGGMEAGP